MVGMLAHMHVCAHTHTHTGLCKPKNACCVHPSWTEILRDAPSGEFRNFLAEVDPPGNLSKEIVLVPSSWAETNAAALKYRPWAGRTIPKHSQTPVGREGQTSGRQWIISILLDHHQHQSVMGEDNCKSVIKVGANIRRPNLGSSHLRCTLDPSKISRQVGLQTSNSSPSMSQQMCPHFKPLPGALPLLVYEALLPASGLLQK